MLSAESVVGHVSDVAMLLTGDRVVPNVTLRVARDITVSIVNRLTHPAFGSVVLAAVSTVVEIGVIDLPIASI